MKRNLISVVILDVERSRHEIVKVRDASIEIIDGVVKVTKAGRLIVDESLSNVSSIKLNNLDLHIYDTEGSDRECF